MNLTKTQKELLLDHHRLGHYNMQGLQHLYRADKLDSSSKPSMISRASGITTCDIPLCFACQISKAKRRPSATKITKDLPSRQDVLSYDQLEPGDRCSMDQYESSVRGRLPHTQGKELEALKYCGGTLFIHHASSRDFAYHQVSLSATDTIISKRKMELEARSCGVEFKSFHSDNGIFKSQAFEKDLYDNEQRNDLFGVGAHHQNGRAERSIQTVQKMARSMLLHAALHWEETYDLSFGPLPCLMQSSSTTTSLSQILA